jgi:hypothetical protein
VLGVIVVLAVLILGERNLLASQPPRNPFADYHEIRPGQSLAIATERGFSCAAIANYPWTTCVNPHSPTRSAFAEVYVSISQHEIIDRVGFIPDGDTLRIGDLIALWGEPAGQLRGSLVTVLCWPGVYALSALNDHHDSTYFSPVKLVEFHSRADNVCLAEASLDN